MLKFQLHSDLINPCPKKFVQKLEINDSNQGFCEGVGKKKEQCPENQQLMDWSAGFLGQILSFFQAANPPDTDYESAEELRLSGREVGGAGDGMVGQLIRKKTVKVFNGVLSLMPWIFFYQICWLLYM